MGEETYTAYYTNPNTGDTGTTEVPVGQSPPAGYTTEPPAVPVDAGGHPIGGLYYTNREEWAKQAESPVVVTPTAESPVAVSQEQLTPSAEEIVQPIDKTEIDDYVRQVAGESGINYLNVLRDMDAKQLQETGQQGTEEQTYLEKLGITQDMDIQEYIGNVGGNYDYYKNLAPADQQIYLEQLGITQDMDNQEQIQAQTTLAPYIATDQWQRISEPNGEFVNPTYNLSAITQTDMKNNPQIKAAVATLFPDYDVNKLGVRYVDINQYKILGQLVPINSLGQLDPNGKVPEAGVPFYDAKLGEIVTPRKGLTLNDYYAKIKVENEAGSYEGGNVPRLYFPIVTLKEWENGNQVILSEQGVVIRPTIQEITKEMAGIDPTKDLTGVDAAKLFGVGFSVPFQVVVPFVATGVGLATKQLSGGWLGVSIASDALSAIPLVRAVSLGARTISTAGKLARATAIADAVGAELIANIKAPFTMLRHPIATIQSGGRTVLDQFENIFSKAKINEAVFSTADYTVRIRIGVDMTEAEALVARDMIVEAGRASGEDIHIQLLNESGEVVSEANVPRSSLMKEIGGAVVHNTPMGEVYSKELAETGIVKVGTITTTEGLPIKDKIFVSLEPHGRFLVQTAGGVTGEQPTVYIWSSKSNVAKSVEQGTKTWKHGYEVEGTVPKDTVLLDTEPAQILYTRIGPNRTKVAIVLVDKVLSDRQLLKLKVLGIIDGIKTPFKQPITFKGGAIDSLTDAELRALSEELELSGNARIADSLGDVARGGDEGLIGSLRASGLIRAGSADDARIFADDLRLRNELNASREAIVREDRRIQESIDREREFIANEDRKIRGESPERITRTEDISRVERIDEGERVSRVEEPERIERVERTERIEEPSRITRAEEPERVARVTETPRITEPPRLNEPPRTVEPPRISEPPRINEPPRIKEPPKRLSPPILGKVSQLSKEQLQGAIGWKQGIMYKYIYPPYGQEDIINSRTPIQGIPIKEGIRSAYETIIRTRKGHIPDNITRHMGMMDLVITDADKNGQPEIKFVEREQRKGRGAVAKKKIDTKQAFTQ
jgi:hypothetical protein